MKTLIVYSSKNGFTKGMADLLQDQIEGEVHAQNCSKDYSVDLTQFDNVIIGSPMYFGKMNSAVLEFCEKYQGLLLTKKVGLFATGADETTALDVLLKTIPDDLAKHADIKAYFGYAFDFDKMSFIHKLIIKKVVKKTSSEKNIKEQAINAFIQDFNRKARSEM
jgi:menaquinone-dependent protoporphyrinogen oxidase